MNRLLQEVEKLFFMKVWRTKRQLIIATTAVVASTVLLGLLATRLSSTALNEYDRTFVADMIPHHSIGMALIGDANQHSDDVRLRRYAFEMQGYHSDEFHRLHRIATEHDIIDALKFPGYINPSEIQYIATLSGPAHDIAWLQTMIVHHLGAVEIAKTEIAHGENTSLVEMAVTTKRVQTAEIAVMRDLLRTLCGQVDDCE